jgi:hypothetical protein
MKFNNIDDIDYNLEVSKKWFVEILNEIENNK